MKIKLKSGFLMREVAGEKVLLPSGTGCLDYSRMLVLNEPAALMVKQIQGNQLVCVDDLVCLLLQQYDVMQETAEVDTYELIAEMTKLDMLEIE